MENSYKFYINKACDYFPCHEGIDEEDFNCMFCYCPLYLLGERCGGAFEMNKGIKNCTDCKIPHVPKGYDYINKKLKEEVFDKAKD